MEPPSATHDLPGTRQPGTGAAASEHVQLLFLCSHNSARSILAEALANHWARRLGRPLRAWSAGSTPASAVHPLALDVLAASGLSTEGLHSKRWDRFSEPGAPALDLVVTVCDDAAAEVCPVFFGRAGEQPVKLHWSYPDPSNAAGDEAARRRAFELTRQAIGYRVLQLLALPLERMSPAERRAALADIVRH